MNKAEYRFKVAIKICTRYGCENPPVNGRKMCNPHIEEHKRANLRWRENLRLKTERKKWRQEWRKNVKQKKKTATKHGTS